ncbi:MAG TPA: nucleotidyltransferase family protein [Planctomycetaceae bacterium]|nr:nucleotidyltransferase family protein [Planctomycetaceae bacterium]
MPATLSIHVPRTELEAFCRRNHIRRLALFGSVLRDDFGPDSDVDVLVEFEAGHTPGLIGFAGMEIDLSSMLGRKVDLKTPGCFRPALRERIMSEAIVCIEFQRCQE